MNRAQPVTPLRRRKPVVDRHVRSVALTRVRVDWATTFTQSGRLKIVTDWPIRRVRQIAENVIVIETD
jgi:hypothetical protein